jgi:hypothetical protein
LADISMVQCGLDVASATMYEVVSNINLLETQQDFFDTQSELERIRSEILKVRLLLETNSDRAIADSELIDVVPPPPVVSGYNAPRKSKRSSVDKSPLISEPDHIKTINHRMDSLVDLIKTSISSQNGGGNIVNQPDDFETWTPAENRSNQFDGTQVQV